jgi:DedD protein
VTELPHDGDDGFHEIQLSGKQLVFLFMATTVVSVVIFLCGVLVGRGVKGDTVNAAESTSSATSTPPPAAAPETTDARTATSEPPTPVADATPPLSYPKALEGDKPPSETLKSTPERKTAPEPAKAEAPPPPTALPPTSPPNPQSGARPGVWAVQVVALSDRTAANAVVQRLSAKGYPAFVVNPQAGAPVQTYKVQVGRFSDRSEAEQVKNRLKKEEQFEPIIRR